MNKNKSLAKIDLITQTINKEKAVVSLYKALNIQPQDDSPLCISYCNEVLALIGLPQEDELPLYHTSIKNWDEFFNDYTAMIYGDKKIEEVLKNWTKKVSPIAVKYDPETQKKIVVDYFEKEQKLVKALRQMGVSDNGPLANLIKDYDLAIALLDKDESNSDLNQDLYETLENGAPVKTFIKKWI